MNKQSRKFTGYWLVAFKNKHTGNLQVLENMYGDPAQFLGDEAAKQVNMLNSVPMDNGEFIMLKEYVND